jgi:hypothetical protein
MMKHRIVPGKVVEACITLTGCPCSCSPYIKCYYCIVVVCTELTGRTINRLVVIIDSSDVTVGKSPPEPKTNTR